MLHKLFKKFKISIECKFDADYKNTACLALFRFIIIKIDLKVIRNKHWYGVPQKGASRKEIMSIK